MNSDTNNITSKINSNKNDLLNEIVDYLQQIIKYTKDNLIKREKNDEINLEENKSDDIELSCEKNEIKDKIKLGEKINRAGEKDDEDNESNEIKKNIEFLPNKKRLKLKEINYHKYINEIIKKIEDIIIKINKNIINNNNNLKSKFQNSKNKNLCELKINSFNFIIKKIGKFSIDKDQEIKYDDGRYIGQVINGLKEVKGIYYYNNGDKFDGEWKMTRNLKEYIISIKNLLKEINMKEIF